MALRTAEREVSDRAFGRSRRKRPNKPNKGFDPGRSPSDKAGAICHHGARKGVPQVIRFPAAQWALILGGSSGFGLATAKKLAACGMSVAIVHRDRRGAMAAIEPEFAAIRAGGRSS